MRLDDAVGALLPSWGRIQVCVRIMYDNVVDDDDEEEEEDDNCVKNWEGL
jgi:hypothetical protein